MAIVETKSPDPRIACDGTNQIEVKDILDAINLLSWRITTDTVTGETTLFVRTDGTPA